MVKLLASKTLWRSPNCLLGTAPACANFQNRELVRRQRPAMPGTCCQGTGGQAWETSIVPCLCVSHDSGSTSQLSLDLLSPAGVWGPGPVLAKVLPYYGNYIGRGIYNLKLKKLFYSFWNGVVFKQIWAQLHGTAYWTMAYFNFQAEERGKGHLNRI